MKKTLYLMRHGQTLFNVRKRIQGLVDSPLTDLGIAQAKRAKEVYFKPRNVLWDHAYCSTSERAADTLELVCDLPYTRLKALKEMNFGKLEGEPEYLNPPYQEYETYFKNIGGESRADVASRMNKTLLEIMNKPDHESVLVVSHGGAIANFYHSWDEINDIPHVRGFKNCCILKFEFDTEKQTFNCKEIYNENWQGEQTPANK